MGAVSYTHPADFCVLPWVVYHTSRSSQSYIQDYTTYAAFDDGQEKLDGQRH